MANEKVQRMDGYDVVIAGAGTTACVLSKELARMGKKVIALEVGDDSRAFLGTFLENACGKHKKTVLTKEGDMVLLPLGLGGGAKTFPGLVATPDYDWWRSYGIDLEPYREWAEDEAWVSDTPDEFIGPGEKAYMEAAAKVGFEMEICQKHIKFERCKPRGCNLCSVGCPNKARWDPTYSAYDAMDYGAKFLYHIKVENAIIENGKAVGFRGKKKDGSIIEARGEVAVCSCGGYGSVAIARKAGLKEAGTTFAGDASVVTWGLLPRGQQGNQIDHPLIAGMCRVAGIVNRQNVAAER